MFGFRTALLCIMSLFTLTCPFTKVEESFNIQAMHDLAFFRSNLSQYDHLEFPGVVPRTFVGAILVNLVASIPLYVCILSGAPKFTSQIIVRLCLGTLNILSLAEFCASVRRKFGKTVYRKLCLITLTQFHFLFYASRTLPNSFALIFVLLSLSYLLRGQDKQFIVLSGIAILVFRSELILFYGPCLLYGLIQGSVRLRPALLLTVFMTAVSSVTTSVLIDSVFWQHLIWPEGIVFYYNTVLNKSGQWGKSPFHWYFTSALPRALLATTAMLLCWFPFALRSLVLSWRGRPQIHFQPMSTGLIFVGLVFVSLYSVLPHKELRFIIYTVPVFNLAASVLWNFLEHSESRLRAVIRQKGNKNGRALSKKYSAFRFCNWLCYAHLLMNLIGTAILLVAARKNYPGGHAMMRLNEVPSLIREPHIHICNLAAQTGVTRFIEEHENWTYNKTEGIENDVHLLDHSLFTHLISEIPTSVLQQQSDKFRPLFFVDGFDGINLQLNWTTVWQFIQFRTSPRLIVYERIK